MDMIGYVICVDVIVLSAFVDLVFFVFELERWVREKCIRGEILLGELYLKILNMI